MKILVSFLCCFVLASNLQCQKNVFQKSPLSGIWVENISNSDTLEFIPEYDGHYPVFWLKRGKDTSNLPKSFSGPYSYELSENTISMRWFLSSNLEFHAYFFELSPDKEILKIGDFYNNPYANKDTLIFRRVE